jgi:7-cyano-7-deazaguanine synthase
MSKAVIPVSGGIDSSVLLAYAKTKHTQVFPITFDYNQRHSKELMYAEMQTGDSFNKISLPFLRQIANTSSLTNDSIDVAKTRDVLGDAQTVNYVPFRNQMLLSIACAYAEAVGADVVYHGAALIDSQAGYWDGSIEFLNSINNLIALNRKHKISIEAPLIDKTKAEIILMGKNLGVDFARTWTCYEGRNIACGHCTSCSSRIKGFLDAGIKDPLQYERNDIPWNE